AIVNTSSIINYGPNILTSDPKFADTDGADNIAGTLDDDLRLLPHSPAIDSGHNGAAVVSNDIRGATRIFNNVVDLGAYESHFSLSLVGGSHQSSPANTTFIKPLALQLSSSFNDPVGSNLPITFTAPLTGASITSPTLVATSSVTGYISVFVIANSMPGSYSVLATLLSYPPITFVLSNTLKTQSDFQTYIPLIVKELDPDLELD
ncbi:MAG: choice-of-anchor Q domain-containing protein, partial [Chloroflexota bacterium]